MLLLFINFLISVILSLFLKFCLIKKNSFLIARDTLDAFNKSFLFKRTFLDEKGSSYLLLTVSQI